MSYSSWYALEAAGTETATSSLGDSLIVGTAQRSAFICPFSLFIIPTCSPSNHFPFFWRLTNVACQILFGSYPVIQIITWHFGNIHCEAAALMEDQKNNSERLEPWKRTWPQCTQLLVTSPPALSFGLVSFCQDKMTHEQRVNLWHWH